MNLFWIILLLLALTICLLYEYFKMSNVLIALQQSQVLIDKDIFSTFEDSIISKLGAATGILSIGATVIGVIVAFLSLYTTMNFNKIEERLKKKEEELDKKYSWINVLPCIILGNHYKLIKDDVYAKKVYEAAVSIDNKNILANYFVGLHYAELYRECNNDERSNDVFLDQAKHYILIAVSSFENGNSSDNVASSVFKVDIYIALGSIYGLLGEKYKKYQIETEAQENFYKAIEYLNKAKGIDSSQAKIYTNLGLTYNNLRQYDKAFDNFKLALLKDKESIKPIYSEGNLPWGKTINNVNLQNKLNELIKELNLPPVIASNNDKLENIMKRVGLLERKSKKWILFAKQIRRRK